MSRYTSMVPSIQLVSLESLWDAGASHSHSEYYSHYSVGYVFSERSSLRDGLNSAYIGF